MLEKWNELVQDEAFVKAINSCKDEEAVLALLKENGIEISSVKELADLMSAKTPVTDSDELEKVSGGGFCIGVGLGMDFAVCFGNGHNCQGDSEGGGGYACIYLGVGLGCVYCHFGRAES